MSHVKHVFTNHIYKCKNDRMGKVNRLLLAVFAVLLSFILRLVYNGLSSFSIDEMISVYLVHAPPFDSLYFNHPPLFYWFLKAWSVLVPASETFYRLINAIFSSTATIGMGLIGYRHFGSRAGITLMFLHAAAPLSIGHSQFLLNYSLFEMLVVFQVYFYLHYVRNKTHKNHVLIFSALIAFTNYISLILIFFEWVLLHIKKINYGKIPVLLVGLTIGLPIIFDTIDFKSMAWQKIEYHSNELAFLPINLIKVFLFISPISIVSILFLFGAFLYNHFTLYRKHIEILLAATALCIGISVYTERFIFAPRYFIFILPFFLIFVERVISWLMTTTSKKIVGVIALLLILSGGINEYFKYMPIKSPNWAKAASDIGNRDNILIVTTLPEYIKYPYFNQLNPGVIRCKSVEQFVQTIENHKDGPIWIIDIYVNFISYQKELFETLNKMGYTYTDFSIQAPNVDPIFLYQIQKETN